MNRNLLLAEQFNQWFPCFFVQCDEQPSMEKFSRFMVHWRSGRIASQSSFPSSVRKYSPCGGMMSVEDEIKALEVHRQHMKLQLEMIEKRISGLKHVGK